MAGDQGESYFAGRAVVTGRQIVVRAAGGKITSVEPDARAAEAETAWIGAGLVDLQVNGFAGIDLNNGAITAENVARLVCALQRVGVTTLLPTLITASPVDLTTRLQAITAGLSDDPTLEQNIAGIHLEGPFISPEDGARGAHPAAHVLPPDWDLFERWQEAAEGRIRIITLSPEWPGAPGFIARCRDAGVIPAIGHTAATPEQIREAVDAGASLSTHLGNGTHAVLPRHPNFLWEQLATDELWASVISDGFHLPDAVLKSFLRVKGARLILVSDSVALAGLPPGAYQSSIGASVVLSDEGRLHLASDPRLLAGSALPLIAGIAHLARSGLTTLHDAWLMASTRPLELLGHRGAAGLVVGEPADLVLFRWNGRDISIKQVIKRGAPVFDEATEKRQGITR